MRFIDLFAGLGGFHKALHELGHTCVFASELDTKLRELYESNWGIQVHGDIRNIVKNNIDIIPQHDILCAGFPCQPFSKAGKQLGRNDERGTLFEEIVAILEFRKPKYFILENVPFIKKHDNENTWFFISNKLMEIGYTIDHKIYSPQDFGIPQHRKRIFIVGSLDSLDHFSFENVDLKKEDEIRVYDFIEERPSEFRPLPKAQQDCLKLWQRFIDDLPRESAIPKFPIWSMEFGATYPFETSYPLKLSAYDLGEYKGIFGRSLRGMTKDEQRINLPNYALTSKVFPEWKRNYIRQCREFYKDNKKYIKNTVKEISKYPMQSWQKLEWNTDDIDRKILNNIIQFRASGIRVKRPDFFPSLVCSSTQTPIIGWQKRFITKQEGLKLQALEGIALPENDTAAFKALGNAVNAKIVKAIIKSLVPCELQVPKKKLKPSSVSNY